MMMMEKIYSIGSFLTCSLLRCLTLYTGSAVYRLVAILSFQRWVGERYYKTTLSLSLLMVETRWRCNQVLLIWSFLMSRWLQLLVSEW